MAFLHKIEKITLNYDFLDFIEKIATFAKSLIKPNGSIPKFGDNDRLSARVAEIIKADLLILLSDVTGLYNKNPKNNKKAKLIKEVKQINKSIIKASSFTNNHFAKGGMTTKIIAAKIATNAGCGMMIVNGNSKKIIQKIFESEEGTYFHPKKRKKNN